MAQPVAPITQKEYLKKYLTGKNGKKKRRKKKPSAGVIDKRSIVVDDDDIKPMENLDEDQLDMFLLSEDAPQVAGIIDDRPDELRTMETFRASERWKVLGDADDGVGKSVDSLTDTSKKDDGDHDDEDMSPVRRSQVDSDESAPRSNNKNDSDESPPRNRNRRDSRSASPVQKQKRLQQKKSSSYGNTDRHVKESFSSSGSKNNTNNNSRERGISPSQDRRKHNQDRTSWSDRHKQNSRQSHSPHGKRPNQRQVSPNAPPPRKIKIEPESPPRRKQASRPESRKNNSSPPHKSKYGREEQRKRHVEDSDESPPRKTKHGEDKSSRRRKHEDSDESPPRKNKHGEDKSSRRRKHEDSDESPPRKNKHVEDKPSRRRKNEDSDESPPRRNKHVEDKPSRRRKHEDSDESPPRRNNHVEDKPSRRRKHEDSDESPPRKPKQAAKDTTSKIRKQAQDSDELPPRRNSNEPVKERQRNKVVPMLGLGQSSSKNSKGASEGYMAPIYRDRKTGKIRDLQEEARQKAEESKKTDVEKEKYTRWGKGLAQVAATQVRVQDALHEVTKPVARYADDADLDRMLRAQDREGDPMLEYMRSKGTNVSVPSKPKYQGNWMPNRYNIPPGHRWDGVDRSSGYEKRWFDNISARRATEEDAYKWSVADM